jgi:hypothetical protein
MDEKKMARWAEEKAVETVLELLDYRQQNGHPFRGIESDLADHMGVHPGTFNVILSVGRSPEFIEKHGYVIPYVPKGPGPKDWAAIAGHDPELLEEIKRGERIRKRDAIIAMRRVLAQSEYREPTFDGRTKAGKREREALVQLEAALISLEHSQNGNS